MQAVLMAHDAVISSMRPGVGWIDMHKYMPTLLYILQLICIFDLFVSLHDYALVIGKWMVYKFFYHTVTVLLATPRH